MDAASLIPIGILASMVLLVMALGMHSTFGEASSLFRNPALLVRSLAMNVVLPLLVIGLVVSFDLRLPVKIALVALAVAPVPPFLPGKQLVVGAIASAPYVAWRRKSLRLPQRPIVGA